jgi:serine/threonine protein kinase
MAMSAPLAHPELSVIDGKYALIRELGSGGSGTVYEAEQLSVGKRVALKTLNQGVATDPEFRARFDAEARAAARIAHANVVDVLDLGVTPDGTPYFVMELLEGETLASLVAARGPLPPRYACELLLQLLAGLAAAHRKGIVHCDLKPANVMVTHPRPQRPLVKVLDFGVARPLNEPASSSGEAKPSMVMGTPMFMAPEQVCGQAIDERTDVYAAAAILYVLVTGQDPFTGRGSREVMEQVARGELRPVTDANPAVPPQLANIIQAGMARKRRDRIGSVEELAEQISQFVDPSVASGPSLPASTQSMRAGQVALLRAAQKITLVPNSELPDSRVVRVDLAPRLVTDSLLMDPRLPKPPARPNLEMGRDFMPLPGDPEHQRNLALRTLRTEVPKRGGGIGPAILAMIAGFGVGVLMAWAAGLI